MAQAEETKRRAEEMIAALAKQQQADVDHNYKVVALPAELGGLRLIDYKGCLFPEMIIQSLPKLESFQFHPSDVLICGFPKTGTTWMEEIVYQLMHQDDDPNDPNRRILKERCPHLENVYEGLAILEKQTPPRFMKSHLHYQAMPTSFHQAKPKVIYTIRNPKDNAVSMYHFSKVMKVQGTTGIPGSFTDHFRAYVQGISMCGPFWRNIQGFWEQRNSGHVLCVFYEDLKKNFDKEAQRIAEFLGISLTESRLEQVRNNTAFGAMKKNKSTNHEWEQVFDHSKGHFFRKGTIGDWKNHLTAEQSQELDNVVEKELEPLGIKFCYELEAE